MIHAILFYSFAAILMGAALGVIFSRNPVHAVMFLVLTFFQSAVLWLLAEAEFLAIVLVLVYVGAVMVLFLFVVMMLDINVERVSGGYAHYLPLGIIVAGLMVTELIVIIWSKGGDANLTGGFAATPEGYSNTEALGAVIYTEHVYAFEIAAVILLLAIIAAITLTMRRRPGLKQQNVAEQVAVRAEDRLRMVQMDAETGEDGS
ncbi:MAG: NADH-quinone oxidoreductase subunit J [Pseudomonadota bacterium]|nr:NADH-quinone oxidoreductase subunit J [Pseudomonadota bacterium]MEE3235690.1 NADH-quinone oxidoreductase subunit J [Pseudomonadota bacterium]